MGLYERYFGAEQEVKAKPKYNFEEMEELMNKHIMTKKAIEALYRSNFSNSEIAELLNLPESTVRKTIGDMVIVVE